jgi:hypothetical protein
MRELGWTARPPLLIIGSPRSGTTFLTRTINRFLDIHIARDGGVFLRFHRNAAWYGDLSDEANLRRLIDDLYQDGLFRQRFLERGLNVSASELLATLPERSFSGLVRHVFSETARTHGKHYWGNKRPSYALHLNEIDAVLPGAKVVHIVRDGRDSVLSMRRATHLLLEKNWYFAATDWKEHVLRGREIGKALGPDRYFELTYEELLTSPGDVFARLLAFIGAGDDAQAQLDRVRTGIAAKMRTSNYGKWRTQMPPHAIRIVERVAGDTLRDLGYPLHFPDSAGRAYSRPHIAVFQIDRVLRNVFTRDFKQFLRTHQQELVSAARGRVRAAWRRTRMPAAAQARDQRID